MTETWHGFREDDVVTMINPATGDDDNGRERTYRKGTRARIDLILDLGPEQGRGVQVVIGGPEAEEKGRAIVWTVDDRDVRETGLPFRIARD